MLEHRPSLSSIRVTVINSSGIEELKHKILDMEKRSKMWYHLKCTTAKEQRKTFFKL